MKKSEKKKWILDYIKSHPHSMISVVEAEFVFDYIENCNPKTLKGRLVPNVPELGRYLSEMHKDGILKRFVHGCTYTHDGFPKWAYVYFLGEKY